MTDEAQNTPRRKKGRSPSYPAIDLEEALDRLKALWDQDRQHPAQVDTILSHWGYSKGSGKGLVVLAALKKYGLLEDEGSGKNRTARISDLGRDILLDERPDSDERLGRIQRAALTPAINAEVREKYGSELPSDANFKWFLVRDKQFTEGGASEFMDVYKRTMEFAQLADSESVVSSDAGDTEIEQEGSGQEDHTFRPPPPRAGNGNMSKSTTGRSVQLPVSQTEWATLSANFPLSDEEWSQMLAVLQAMRPGLTKALSEDE